MMAVGKTPCTIKPLYWVGPTKQEFLTFPEDVIDEVGFVLYLAQIGLKGNSVKPLKGFGGAGILEIVEDYKGDTYRAVYTVKLKDTVYVLHCFQKKSKKGIGTPKETIDLIKKRFKTALEMHED